MRHVVCGVSSKFDTYSTLVIITLHHQTSNIKHTKSPNVMFLVLSCTCLCPIHWSQVLSWEWRCSWSSAERRCSNYILVTTILLPAKMQLILEVWLHVILWQNRLFHPLYSPGTPSSVASLSPNSFAHSTQSSMLTFLTGMKGHTSKAPIRGCSPEITSSTR